MVDGWLVGYECITSDFVHVIAAKIPFPLTQRFRSMLQRGIELGSLDVTYVSSQSW
jgi:hypothetical protein